MDQPKPEAPKPSRAGCLSILAGVLVCSLALVAPLLLRLLSGPHEYPSRLFTCVTFGWGLVVFLGSGSKIRAAFLLLSPVVVLGTWMWTLLHWTSGDDGGGMNWSILVGGVSLVVSAFCVFAAIMCAVDKPGAERAGLVNKDRH